MGHRTTLIASECEKGGLRGGVGAGDWMYVWMVCVVGVGGGGGYLAARGDMMISTPGTPIEVDCRSLPVSHQNRAFSSATTRCWNRRPLALAARLAAIPPPPHPRTCPRCPYANKGG